MNFVKKSFLLFGVLVLLNFNPFYIYAEEFNTTNDTTNDTTYFYDVFEIIEDDSILIHSSRSNNIIYDEVELEAIEDLIEFVELQFSEDFDFYHLYMITQDEVKLITYDAFIELTRHYNYAEIPTSFVSIWGSVDDSGATLYVSNITLNRTIQNVTVSLTLRDANGRTLAGSTSLLGSIGPRRTDSGSVDNHTSERVAELIYLVSFNYDGTHLVPGTVRR